MANLLILAGAPIAAIAASRGSGAEYLLTDSPKEVWQDSASGSAANIDIDLSVARPIDSVFLGSILPPLAGAAWTITGGLAGYGETVLKAAGALRAVDRAGMAPALSHALWTGAATTVRYLRLAITQPGDGAALSIGNVIVGSAFQPHWNKEWGSGRRVIDTGTVTPLIDGGFAVVEGARKGSYGWTFGDLADDEVDRLYALQLDRGETRPLVVAEDPAATDGQMLRLHYCRFVSLKAYERRDPSQTRWDLAVEDWL